jgi:hypothetical protein
MNSQHGGQPAEADLRNEGSKHESIQIQVIDQRPKAYKELRYSYILILGNCSGLPYEENVLAFPWTVSIDHGRCDIRTHISTQCQCLSYILN